jgi:hypothetical protein
VTLEGVAKGVSDNLDTWAPDTVVAAFESLGDLVLSGDAKTLGDQSA